MAPKKTKTRGGKKKPAAKKKSTEPKEPRPQASSDVQPGWKKPVVIAIWVLVGLCVILGIVLIVLNVIPAATATPAAAANALSTDAPSGGGGAPTPSPSTSLSAGAIAGIVIGAIALAFLAMWASQNMRATGRRVYPEE